MPLQPQTDVGGAPIQLDEEVDGEELATKNYRFSKIGEPVPIINSDDATTSKFDPQSLPSQPLAVSERFGLLFLAHPQGQGFYVVRTKDVMASAEAIKDKKTAPSVEELSLVDVPIGKVSILALSADHSLLAATVSTHLHFFAVSALLHKDQKPSYSVSLDNSICIKDLRWAKKDAKAYIILSSDGKLYHGSGQGPLNCVMEGVDSVDWSIKGNYIAVAKNNVVSILSSRFKEKLSFLLSFQSVIGDSEVNQVIKVDSIRWIRPDSLAVGCFQLNDDGEEENYMVQVITSRGRRITDASSKPIVLSFNNIFIDFCSDAVPTPTGPHLFLSYLDLYGLAFVANRNLSLQVQLFCWPQDSGKNEAARVEILDDSWTLYIDSQGDDEENVILGLSVDKTSQNENLRFTLGDEEKEVAPCCVIICLTIDGKISVYHFASAAGALTSAERCASSEEDDASEEPIKHEIPLISSAGGEESRKLTTSLTAQSCELSGIEVEKTSAKVTTANNLSPPTNLVIRPKEQTTVEKMGSQTVKVDDPKKSLTAVLNAHSNAEHPSMSELVTSKAFFSGKVVGDVSCQSVSNYPPLGSNVEPLHKVLPSTTTPSESIARVDASKIPDKVDNSDKNTLRSAGSILKPSTDLKEKSSVSFTSFGQTALSAQGNRNSLLEYPNSQMPSGSSFASGKAFQSESKKELNAPPSPPLLTHFMQNVSKQFGNVEEMAKKLDNLLEGIEGNGGFRDASITSHTKYVSELEEGIWALSEKCRMWKGLLNDKLGEIQVLLEKTVEVLARKIYMEGLFKQTTDRKYWEFWNRKKLSSELELKQRRILDLNQELTNKLIELERHFNALEFNKFRENEGAQRDRRALQNRQGRSRQIQSLHSVHNTITAQLSAAEQLSGCLSKQMAALCIESSGKHDVKKQLFESIGLAYVGDSERSPARDRTSIIPANKEYSIASGSIGAKDQSRRNQSGHAKGSEPQTARRRRDSLDRSWVNFDPPKSTVKRVLKEDYEKGSPNRSLLNINKQFLSPKKSEVAHSELSITTGASMNHHKNKACPGLGTSAQQFTESPSSLFHTTAGFQERGIQVSLTKNSSTWLPPSISQTRLSQNSELGAFRLGEEKTKSSLPSTGTKYSFAGNESKFVQQSDMSFRPLASMSEQLPEQSRISPFGSTGSLDHLEETTKDQKNTNLMSETLLDYKFPVTMPTAFSSAPTVVDKGLFSKISETPSRPKDSQSASSPLQSALGSQSPSSLVSKPVSSTLFLAPPFRSEASMVAKEEVSQWQTSVASSVTLPSALASSTNGSSFASVSSLAMYGSKNEVQTKVDNIPSKTETGAKVQTSVSQPAVVISTSDLKLRTSASSALTELTNSRCGSEDDIGGSSNNYFVASDIKAEIPSATEAISTVAVSSEGINGSMKSAISNSSHEEEMEEEAPETDQPTEFTFTNLDGFGIGSTQNSTTAKANPFGVAVLNKDSTFATSQFIMPTSSGELFRPASFNFQPPQPSQPLQPPTVNFSGGFGSGVPGQVSGAAGFGQPAHIGAGQQALGSVLGSFGQSRQLGAGLPASNAGFGNAGFTSAPSSGGFGNLAAGGGGFAAAATGGGGFAAAAAATGGGGFAAATGGGGFAAAPVSSNAGGGFMSSATGAAMSGGGGFGGFSNHQPSGGGFSAFSSSSGSGAGRPPSQFFTQMRK
ncbi:hypothetical protein C2S52_000196 [Perilla frutescens var. hirtella]|nr:hypothetical protein C2S52_000196 [Perilla frutescens var. hirtella]